MYPFLLHRQAILFALRDVHVRFVVVARLRHIHLDPLLIDKVLRGRLKVGDLGQLQLTLVLTDQLLSVLVELVEVLVVGSSGVTRQVVVILMGTRGCRIARRLHLLGHVR